MNVPAGTRSRGGALPLPDAGARQRRLQPAAG